MHVPNAAEAATAASVPPPTTATIHVNFPGFAKATFVQIDPIRAHAAAAALG